MQSKLVKAVLKSEQVCRLANDRIISIFGGSYEKKVAEELAEDVVALPNIEDECYKD